MVGAAGAGTVSDLDMEATLTSLVERLSSWGVGGATIPFPQRDLHVIDLPRV